ncbi:MBL fold metallo-hydrolase [Cohnella fermenti]|uniref:MBL fold metallo-hydrolase n=1 Tax=Cohnella fermenti TaxID=2565925 RepID=A0A4V3WEF1_9BACL|nr:MBL fold metallo-hydrolase [Cohnella fermenti]
MAPGIAMLSIAAPVLGRMDTVHPVLVWDERDVVLVDTGFPRQLPQLLEAVESLGVPRGRLNRIIMTHQDIDHIGNLQALVENTTVPIEVTAHALEKPYIQGERRLLKFTDEAIASIDRLPPQVPESFRQGLKALMLNPPKAPVDRVVADGDRLPWGGGLLVIATPGHTPGHISLFHEPSRTLIAGDALVVRDGRLLCSEPETTLDMEAARASARKLSGCGAERVVCYHGGLFAGDIARSLSER